MIGTRGHAVQAEGIVERQYRLPVHGFIDNACASADDRLSISDWIPRDADAGAKFGGRRYRPSRSAYPPGPGRAWDEIAEQIVGVFDYSVES